MIIATFASIPGERPRIRVRGRCIVAINIEPTVARVAIDAYARHIGHDVEYFEGA